jgi:hypothetical protein
MASGAPNAMMTLTLPADAYSSPQAGIDALHAALRTLAKEMRSRHGPTSFEYFAVPEMTRRRTPHLHVLLCTPWIEQSWLSKFMLKHGAGRIVDIRAIRHARGAARYLTKYLTKSGDYVEARRSYSISALFEDPLDRIASWERKAASIWRYTIETVHDVVESWQRFGYAVEWIDGNEAHTTGPPMHNRKNPLHA